MARTQRTLTASETFESDGIEYQSRTDFSNDSGGPLANSDHVVIQTPFPIYLGSAQAVTQVVVWGVGLVSFGMPTAAQIQFMQSWTPAQPISGFPGDYVAAGLTSAPAGTIRVEQAAVDEFGNPYDSFDGNGRAVDENGNLVTDAYDRVGAEDRFILTFLDGAFAQITFSRGGYAVTQSSGGTFGYRLNGVTGLETSFANDFSDSPNLSTDYVTTGDDGDDILLSSSRTSSALAETLAGLAGLDLIQGGGGNDLVLGGLGDDQLFGETGDDELSGDEGNDFIDGGDGYDLLRGGSGADTLAGGLLDDLLEGGIGSDELRGGDGNDRLFGDADSDLLVGGAGNDRLDGGSGADNMEGGDGDDLYFVDSASDIVTEQSGAGVDEVRTALSDYTLAANAELLTGLAAIGQTLRGNTSDNIVVSGAGDDRILLQDGGSDQFSAGVGTDRVYFGGALGSGDAGDGGEGSDSIILQGDYDLVMPSLTGFEIMSLQTGSSTFWGQSGTNSYDFDLTAPDALVAAGLRFRIVAQSLRAGEDFTFDGSAETDGSFLIYAGFGTDVLTGGAGNDTFFFEAGRFTAGDRIDGRGGNNGVVISGAAPGQGDLVVATIASGTFTDIDALSFNAALATNPSAVPSYQVVLAAGNIAAGANMIVNANSLGANQTLDFDASAELLGSLSLFGGGGTDRLVGGANGDVLLGQGRADTLTGGGGADLFQYRAATDSTLAAPDRILDFEDGIDRIDLSFIDADANTAGNQAFSFIGSGAFSGAAGQVRAVNNGGNEWTIEADVDGNGAADLRILLTTTSAASFGANDFVL